MAKAASVSGGRRTERGAEPLLPIASTSGGLALFGVLGAAQALFGPLIPAMRASFHITVATSGLVLSAFFVGAIGGTILSGLSASRVSLRWRVTGATALLALGCWGMAAAQVWAMAIAAALVMGLGDGGLVVTLNSAFASAFGSRGPAMLNLLNATFGAGAVAGPLIVGTVVTGTFRLPYFVCGVLVFLILPTFLGLPNAPATGDESVAPQARRLFPLLIFVSLFFCYEGLEADIGGWEATQLIARGYSTAAAANATAVFWASLTLGRILIAPLSVRIRPERLVLLSLSCMLVLMLAAHVPAITLPAYTLGGLALASIFPSSFLWIQTAFPGSKRAAPAAILGALAGGAIFPPLVGRWIASSTPDVLPTALSAIGALCLLVTMLLYRLAPVGQ